jgi:predicted transcriptional regulator
MSNTIITAQVDQAMVDRLRAVAQREDRSLSGQLRKAIGEHLERHELDADRHTRERWESGV